MDVILVHRAGDICRRHGAPILLWRATIVARRCVYSSKVLLTRSASSTRGTTFLLRNIRYADRSVRGTGYRIDRRFLLTTICRTIVYHLKARVGNPQQTFKAAPERDFLRLGRDQSRHRQRCSETSRTRAINQLLIALCMRQQQYNSGSGIILMIELY